MRAAPRVAHRRCRQRAAGRRSRGPPVASTGARRRRGPSTGCRSPVRRGVGAAGRLAAMTTPLVITRDDDPARRAAAARRGRRGDARGGAATPVAALRRLGRRAAGAGRRRRRRRAGRARGPPRRDGVHVVALGRGRPTTLFRIALALGAENVAELPRSEAWLVELLTDVGDAAPRAGWTVGVVGGSGGAGATTFAVRARPGRRAAPGRPSWSTPTRSARARPGARPRGPTASAGTTLLPDDRPAQRPRRCARRCRGATGSGVLTWTPGRSGTPAGVRGARGAVGRAARARPGGRSTCPAPRDPVVDEVVARCDRVLVVAPRRPCPASPRRPGVRRGVPGRPAAAGAARPRASTPRDVARGRPACRCWPRWRDQRGLAEAIDLGLGPGALPARRRWRRAARRRCSPRLAALRAAA